MSKLEILEGCEDFAFGDGPTGVVVTHGYTSSPQNVRELGKHLADNGLRVVGPRLPGHGTTWEDLATRTPAEWRETLETEFDKLKAECDQVFLVGLSFGGALSLDLAERRPDEVAGVIGLAPFLFTKDPRRHLAPIIRRVVKALPGVGNDIADPSLKEVVYDKVPTSSTYLMLRFCKDVTANLDKVTAPVLMMHGRQDHTAPPECSQVIYDNVSSEDKELIWLDRSYHVITLDYERDDVAAHTLNFIKERSKHAV